MNKKSSLILLIHFMFLTGLSISYGQLNFDYLESIEKPTIHNFIKAYDLEASKSEKKLPGWKQYKRWEYFWEQRLGKSGELISTEIAVQIYNEAQKFYNDNKIGSRTQAAQWVNMGPNLHSNIAGHGRVNIVRINPSNDNDLWIGTAGGGVWRSQNGGVTWTNFPFTEFLSLGVSDIAISPTNPQVIYVSTGDFDGMSSTLYDAYSVGIIKTTNSGNTWEFTSAQYELDRNVFFSRLLIDPNNPDIVVAGSTSGIYKTTDGGATWSNTLQSGAISDIEYFPADYDNMYATLFSRNGNAGFYKSTNAGTSWQFVESFADANRIAITVSPANPDKMYALLSHTNNGYHSFMVLDRQASDEFVVQSSISTVGNLLGWGTGSSNDEGGQGFYDLCIAANPNNENDIYIGGINIWRSTTGGRTWALNAHQWGAQGKPYVHADQHDLLFSPNGDRLYSANDGGMDYTSNGGSSWRSISEGIEASQFYRLGGSAQNSNLIYAGAQDNGTSRYLNGNWVSASGGDGMEAVVDPNNQDRAYVSSQLGNIRRRDPNTGQFRSMLSVNIVGENASWLTPYLVHEVKSNRVYAGYINVWLHENYGADNNWTKISNFSTQNTLRTLAISPKNENYIYTATWNTMNATTNGGNTWEIILSSNSSITYIFPHPTMQERVYITKSGFVEGDKVYMYDGTNWHNLSGNLPNVPVNCVVYQKDSPDRIYAGTDIGVFYSDYNSSFWMPYGEGLPNVVVSELEINYNSRKLRASTYGRSLWETDLLDCDLEPVQVNVKGDLTFCEGESVILEAAQNYPSYRWSNGATTKSIEVFESGTYSLMIPTGECSAKSIAITVNVLNVGNLEINPSQDGKFCEGDTAILSASFGFPLDSYEWSDGTKSRRLETTLPGTYTVTALTSDGCPVESESFELEFMPRPEKPEILPAGKDLTAPEADNYQWYLNGDKLSGANKRVLTPIVPGEYQVEVFNEHDCSSISDVYNLITSVETNSESIFNISPNPSNGLFRLETDYDGIIGKRAEITDMLGRKILKLTIENITEINLSSSPAGIYLLTIELGNQRLNYKLIKK